MNSPHYNWGSSLLYHWNFPEKYCKINQEHHSDEFATKNLLLAMVRVADRACNKLGIGLRKDSSFVLSATPESKVLQVYEVDLANFEIYLEDTHVFD